MSDRPRPLGATTPAAYVLGALRRRRGGRRSSDHLDDVRRLPRARSPSCGSPPTRCPLGRAAGRPAAGAEGPDHGASSSAEAELLAGRRARAPTGRLAAPRRASAARRRLAAPAAPGPGRRAGDAAAGVGVAGGVAARRRRGRHDGHRATGPAARRSRCASPTATASSTVAALPAPPSGRVYQVWLVTGQDRPRPTDALFTVSATAARAWRSRQSLDGADQVLVTDEPPGGSAQPTGTVVRGREAELS